MDRSQNRTLPTRPLGDRSLVESLRCDIGPVRPHNSASIHKEFPEICRLLERLEDRAFHPRTEVNRPLRKVVEGEVEAKPSTIVGADHARQKRHKCYSRGS